MKTQPPAESLSKLSITTYFLTFKLSFSKEKAIFFSLFFKDNFRYLSSYFWLCWVFRAGRAFLQLWRGGTTPVVMRRLLIEVASFVSEHGPIGHMGYSICGSCL